MTTLSLLGGDWLLSFNDENVGALTGQAGLRKLEYVSGPVRSTNEVYSAVADNADEFQAMGFDNPMLPVTPNAYTMESQYFIPRSSCERLKEGAITANWSVVTGNGNGVLRVEYTGGTGPAAGDIGRRITQSGTGDTGTLLDYDVDPDGVTTVAWIRPDTDADTFSGTGALTASGGTMATTASVAGISGVTQYTAIQAIGSVPTATEVYVVQDRIKLLSSTGGFQWWDTDTNVSLGIISILVRVIDSGITIANGDVEVFARRYTSLYDNFRLNVAAGGFQALPLASQPDINNTTGYRTFTGSGGSNTFDVGNAIYVGSTYATATKKGVITAVGGTTGAPVIAYYLIGDLTDFVVSDAVKEYIFATASDGDATCTAGTPGSNAGGPTDTASGEGGSVTITLGAVSADHDGNAVNESYSINVNAQSNVLIAKVYERLKYGTRRGATTADLFGAGTNVPGETYRGLEGTFEYDANTGTMTQGDDLIISTRTNFSARLMAQITTPPGTEPTHITMTDIQTSLTSAQPADNDVVEDETGDDVTLTSGGTVGIQRYTSPKAAPFGTFTGSQIFGARGVYYSNPAPADTQAYILTDNLGFLRTPPNTVSFLVQNTRAGDRIFVARDTGTAGIIDKDQFGGMTAVAVSSKTITVAGSIDSEVPTAGWVRVVETTLQQEHRYVYDSRVAGASGVFTLRDITAGTATAGTSDTVLEDTGSLFVTEGVEIGMLIYVAGRTSTYEVVSITDEDSLVIKLIFGAGGFVSTDTYTINETIQTYAVTDDIFDLIIDAEETVGTDGTPGSISNTFVQSTSFGVVVNVRQGKIILPFSQNASVGASGGTSTVVRQPDTIAT